MDQLPGEILIDILSRLPIKSLMRCRCVCKPWLHLTLDPRFAHTHLSRSSQANPNLILNCSNFLRHDLYFAEPSQTHDFTFTNLRFSITDLDGFVLVGSCNGLMCLVRKDIYVCNPCTGEYIKLPDPIRPSQRRHEKVGFGFSPKTNEFKVVEMIHDPIGIRMGISEVFVFTLGGESWRDLGDVPYAIVRRSASVVFVNGALHWVSLIPLDLIVSFDVVDEVFRVIPRPEFGPEEEGCYSLGVLSKCLSFTDSSFDDRVEIWVMKDYGVVESWTKYFAINFNQVGWNIRFSKTVCLRRDGKLVLMYDNEDLLLYDPQTSRLRKITIDGLPPCFQAITHVAGLISPLGYLRRD